MWNGDSQHQRHGVTKNLVEGIGGVVVGAAAVLLLRSLFKSRRDTASPSNAATPVVTVNEESSQ